MTERHNGVMIRAALLTVSAAVFGLLAQAAAGDISIPQTIGYTSVCTVLLGFAAAAIRHIVKLYEARIEALTKERDYWREVAEKKQ